MLKRKLPAENIVLKNTIDSTETVCSANFFTVFIGSSIVGNSHFVNTNVGYATNLSSYLWLKSKTVFFKRKALYHFGVKQLVTGFHI